MRRILVLTTLVLALAACGGSSGGGNTAAGPAGDPVGAVNSFVNAIKAKSFATIGSLVCAAKRYDIANSMGATASSGLLDAVTFDVQNLNVQQSSVNGDAAVVHIKGKLVTTVDAGKAKDAIKKEPGGAQLTDDQINQFVTAMNTSRDIDQDVDVVKENGGWLICSNLDVTGG